MADEYQLQKEKWKLKVGTRAVAASWVKMLFGMGLPWYYHLCGFSGPLGPVPAEGVTPFGTLNAAPVLQTDLTAKEPSMSQPTESFSYPRTAQSAKSKVREYAEALLWAIVVGLTIRYCVIQAYRIPSGSMEDTLLIGDQLFVNKFIYGIRIPFTETRVLKLRDPKRGDVMVFRFPEDRSKDFIKRVVGVPGDEIRVTNKQVYVNGALYRNPHEVHKEASMMPREANPRDNCGPIRVPADSYFMMGDNRDRSYDSRFWGFAKTSDIRGKAIIKFWSWDSDAWRVRWERIGRLID